MASLVGLVLGAIALLGSGRHATAADGLVVSKVDTTGYPTVALTVDVDPSLGSLTADALTVTEDGAAVVPTVTPFVGPGLEVVVVADASDAARTASPGATVAAAGALLDDLPATVRAGVVVYGGTVEVLGRPGDDRAATVAALAARGQVGDAGPAALYDAVATAGGLFSGAARERLIVLVAAGADEVSTATVDDAAAALGGARVEVLSLANDRSSPLALARLAIEGRGNVVEAAGTDGLRTAAAALANTLRGRSLVTYTSRSAGPTIDVVVSSPFGSSTSHPVLPAGAVPPATAAPPTTATAAAPPTTAAVAVPPTTAAAPTTSAAAASPSTVAVPATGTATTVAARAASSDEGGGAWLVVLAAAAVVALALLLGARWIRRGAGPAVDGEPLDADDTHDDAYDYDRFSTLAGSVVEPGDGPYRVAYRSVLGRRGRALVLPFVTLNMVAATGFYLWLVQPAHLPETAHRGVVTVIVAHLMLAGIVLIEGMRLVSSFALSWWAWRARDPVPVTVEPGLRVAFTTTIVPSREPIDVVRRTLEAAKLVRHDGVFDVWILDEGNDPRVREMCRELGVRHFTRHRVAKWNRTSGRFKARTKHGNHNAWLWAHGRNYDVEISVDPDHAPLPNVCERLLGYFRDPDVAFVCGPQVYGNYTTMLTRAAESQAYLFQSVIQRAANRSECGMFVGTNHAYRISAWRQIGGFQDSITEDMATSFAVHGAQNPATGNHWKSVYTPDVVAVGEGPATWTDFFSQQLRWARGTDDVLVRGGRGRFRKLPRRRRLHYALLCSYYPFVAVGWLVGLALSAVYVMTGTTGLHLADLRSWFTLYADLALVQCSLYFWLRRLNVSPHEPAGSAGIAGMFVSMLATPIYVTALVGAVLRRPLGFVVTPKGQHATTDGLPTFRRHLWWAALSCVIVAAAFVSGRALWAALLAPLICLFVSLTPIALWLAERRRAAGLAEPVVLTPSADTEILTEVTA